MTAGGEIRHDLVLVGGGHAHVQVLRAWAMRPLPGIRLTVVVDRPTAVYSGMVPGFVAGQYRRDELEIDVRPLALRAGARFIVTPAVGLDPRERLIHLEGRPPIRYDTAAFDVGSTVAGLALPGVREHALATRPIGRFVEHVEALLARARERGRCRLVAVGAGAGGVELAFAFRARLEREGVRDASVLLLESGSRVLPGYPAGATRRVEANARARGIEIRLGAKVAEARATELVLADGERIPFDELAWVAGAASLPLFHGAGVALDERGFVRVRRTLQLLAHEDIFAVGDCASLEGAEDLAKAGVYAVRQGPVLTANLRARLMGQPLEPYRPQRDFLSLLNLGDGRAIGSKWGASVEGASVFKLKDRIDRRFVDRFQVLRDDGALTPMFSAAPAMGGDDMVCGGCAAKVGESTLSRALERLGVASDPSVVLGLGVPDDVAAVATERGEIVVSSVDGFRAFTDDPYLVGRVAAVNAASDLWAKGATPRWALASVEIPELEPARAEETLYQTLAGARAALDADGITLVGGHTTSGADLHVGFAVHGTAPSADALMRKGGVSPGERLILTKPLGTGVLFFADMRGRARGEWMEAAVASMLRSNAAAARVARAHGATACTDVSGFGLAGHLGEMLRASKCAAVLDLAALPLLPGAAALLARGDRSTFHPENARSRRALRVHASAQAHPALDILFDPQTSGGLLFAVPAERAEAALAALRASGDGAAALIGDVTAPRGDQALFEVVARPTRG
ncbi:MAG TPA: selenide, water dikinase SelD [Candidatus Nitrosocosmicus sp.]|nr:selenide, water dikinase SelD [Candidatus Nitrosocosmicus sp.]